ncbi:hypothetical protein [Sphingomonas sp. MMS24-J13]|uniref:hypothetical protein n=1 Tax=Sphingomonas sp. MMS24-J13 TaxID=3238686 RepID=UPI00384E3198
MAWHTILYNALLVTCVPYALLRGGAPERWCAAVALLATILSVFALSRSAIVYQDAEVGTLIVDGLALAAFFTVALFADRFWPLLVAGLQADAVIIHLCKLIRPDILPLGYAIGLSIWSYPILIVLAIGTARHRRRLATRGSDPAWSAGMRSVDLPLVKNRLGEVVPLDRSREAMRKPSTGGLR